MVNSGVYQPAVSNKYPNSSVTESNEKQILYRRYLLYPHMKCQKDLTSTPQILRK